MFLKISQNSQENTCARASFLIKLQAEPCSFIKKEALAQVFSCGFCEIFKNTFFIEHLRWLLLLLVLNFIRNFALSVNVNLLLEKKNTLLWCFIPHIFEKILSLKPDSHLPKKISFYLLQWKPLKNDERCFLFYFKSSFRSQNI